MSASNEIEVLASFGKRLRSLRNLFAFSREDFAEILCVDISRLDEFEEGRAQPIFRILRRISDLTTCDIDSLIMGSPFGEPHDKKPITKEWEALFGKLIAGDQVVKTAWYWETDEQHRFTLTCKPPLGTTEPPPGPRTSTGIIGRTRWENVGQDVKTNEHWARHYQDLESRTAIHYFIFRGNSGFVKVWGKPAYDHNGRFVGYRGYAGPATLEEAMSQWRASLTKIAS